MQHLTFWTHCDKLYFSTQQLVHQGRTQRTREQTQQPAAAEVREVEEQKELRHSTTRVCMYFAMQQLGYTIIPHYQQIIDRTGALCGYEVLGRVFDHQTQTMLMPDMFIPVLQARHLLAQFDLQIAQHAIAQLRAWGIPLSVNASPDLLTHEGFVRVLIDTLDNAPIPVGTLMLEIHETCTLPPTPDVRLAMYRLGQHGVRFAVDDFPTNRKDPDSVLDFLSTTAARTLRFGALKLDKYSITDTVPTENDCIATYITRAHELGLRVIAEGVETEQQHDTLFGLGVDAVQGFLHGKPEPAQHVFHITHPEARIEKGSVNDAALCLQQEAERA